MTEKTKASKYLVRQISHTEVSNWDDFIDQADHSTIFHKLGWLQSAAKHSKTKLFPLVCEKPGSGIIAVFPVFWTKKFFLNILFSPPPGCAIPYLGPVFRFQSDKQSRIETDQYGAMKAFDNYIRQNLKPDYFHTLSIQNDVRPFKWLQYETEPAYTYRLYLRKESNKLFAGLESNIRNKIKKIEKEETASITSASPEFAESLVNDIRQRYKKLGRSFKPSKEYINELLSHYGGKELQLYNCHFEGKHQTSFLTLHYKNNIKFWLGGINNERIVNGINEYIHWHLIQKAAKEGYEYYEHIGANTQHLCAHKSRYGFRPEVYYKVEKWTLAGKLFFGLYSRFRNTSGN